MFASITIRFANERDGFYHAFVQDGGHMAVDVIHGYASIGVFGPKRPDGTSPVLRSLYLGQVSADSISDHEVKFTGYRSDDGVKHHGLAGRLLGRRKRDRVAVTLELVENDANAPAVQPL
jgi:hypothetical protein